MMNTEDDINIPLVDEINELLHKERTLLGLKVMEHQVEAEEWKKKYETLVHNIGTDNTSGGSNAHVYELAADVAQMEENWQKDLERILYLQHQCDYPWCLDVSHIDMRATQIKQVINFPKSHNFQGVSVLKLNHCEIQDSDAEVAAALLHFPGLQALDLSHNDLGHEFHAQLLNDIERRRLKLQYLLLDGNPGLSHCNFENLVHHLSGHTWGLSVTLMDMGRVRQHKDSHGNTQKTTHRMGSHHSHTAQHKEASGENPHLALRFLRNLNYALDQPSDKEPQHNKGKTATSRDRSKIKTLTSSRTRSASGGMNRSNMSAQRGGLTNTTKDDAHDLSTIVNPALRRQRGEGVGAGGPQLLAVLGITNAWLCKESITQLQRSLEVTIASLTDLDITHSLIGYRGALMIGTILSREACQLVRLNMTGNGIGDRGLLDGLLSPLKASHTLTYLNLQSNNLTDIGVRAIGLQLSRKQTLRRLLIDGNPFTPDSAIFAQRELLRSGAQVHLIWTPSAGRVGVTASEDDRKYESVSVLRRSHTHLRSLYTAMGQISVAVDPASRSAKVYSIASHHLRPLSEQFSASAPSRKQRLQLEDEDDDLGMVVIRWDMGVRAEDSVSRRDHMRCRLAFEIRQNNGNRSSIVCRKTLLSSACLPNGQKTRCSATVSVSSSHCSLEVWAVVVATDNSIGLERDGNGLFLECSSMEVSRALVGNDDEEQWNTENERRPTFENDLVLAGGDAVCWSAAMNGVISTSDNLVSQDSTLLCLSDMNGATGADPLPDNYHVVRKFKWIGQPLLMSKIQFQARLCTVSGGHVSSSTGSSLVNVERDLKKRGSAPKAGHVGYSWRVLRCRHDCGVSKHECYETVAEGDINTWGSFGTGDISNTAKEEGGKLVPSANQLLAPWLWQDISATVENVALNDGFLICCRISSRIDEAEEDSGANSAQLGVSVKNMQVTADVQSFNGWEDLLNEGDFTPTLIYSTFNDPDLQMAR